MPGFSRRQLFKLRLGDLSREVGRAVSGDGGEEEGVPFIRPPGALEDEDAFLDTCERCHACAGACPYDVVRLFGPAFGPLEGTPFLEPAVAPCHWCEDMPCITACPSGALAREDGGAVPPIAKVSLDLDKCLNTTGTLCDTCSYRCPDTIRAIRMVRRRPVVDLDRCTGCGMCVYHCDAEPSAFEIVHLDADPSAGPQAS
ncbi:MAG: 4Fe-4S binding protein [Akkermansiaceae bacterium]|nr:4Fe-4S binding protein [Akkermansiaceae bacterium]NNM31409.1 4Fe-4S binding protein [Akkermansiaceae bacterium]